MAPGTAPSSPDELPIRNEAGEGYPPETYHLMTWSAIQFIHRPHPRAIGWITLVVFAVIAAMFGATFFLPMDVRVEAAGQIEAEPSAVAVGAESDGVVAALVVVPGARVAAGDVIANLQLEAARPDVEATIAGLDDNSARIDSEGAGGALGARWEIGDRVAAIRDPGIRDASAALEDLAHRWRGAQVGSPPGAADREELRRASRRLGGLLRAYLEARRLTAPIAGTLLQYQSVVGARVRAGDVVARILPEGAALVVVVVVDPTSLPRLAVGQRVQHILDAYPYQQYGLFEGTVLAVRPSAAQSEEPGHPARYHVVTSIDTPSNGRSSLRETIRLLVGMGARTSIVTERRTLYEAGIRTFLNRS